LNIFNEFQSLTVRFRFAIVAYRDLSDDPPFEIQQFKDNVDEIRIFLDKLIATGGNDIPEDILGALEKCLNSLDWNQQANGRCILLITDAPGHGKELNDDPNDANPNDDSLERISRICGKLQTKNAHISLMLCTLHPQRTFKMQRAFESCYQQSATSDIDKAFTVIDLVDRAECSTPVFHFVFVLDESNSMINQPWNDLQEAFQKFLKQRQNGQNQTDMFSVIQFSTTARIAFERQSFSQIASQPLVFKGGDTYYLNGLTLADQIIAQDKSNSFVIMIFMSDGADLGSDPTPTIKAIREKYTDNDQTEYRHQFECHTVGFGNKMQPGTDERKLLEKMAKDGGGQMYEALDGLKLKQVFEEIAQGCSRMSDALIKKFAKTLSEAISMKISLDYL
jgi:uncharacterized protein YegL